jgi:hypothetical protein
MFYDRPYKVKKWIVALDLNEKQAEALKKAMPKKVAKLKPWISLEMPQELQKLANEGYHDHVNQNMPYFLDMTLALRAMVNLTRRYNPLAQISHRPAYHRVCANRIEKESDYVRLATDILKANDDTTLSQVFDLAKHENDIFVSHNADIDLARRLAAEVVIIGNTENCDLNLSDLTSTKELSATLSSLFKDQKDSTPS